MGKRKIIEINEELCNGCGQCILSCAEGALKIVGGKAKVVSDIFCDGLGACLSGCPTDALKIVEREAPEFDEKAVEEHLHKMKAAVKKPEPVACGCPSSQIRTFQPSACDTANTPKTQRGVSSLSHWPVQIKLVPPTAPFLKGASLLVAADCTAFSYPDFHDLMKGKALMIGCPKFDDAEAYVAKFAEVFKTADVKDVTVAIMEVPCCSMLPRIVQAGLDMSGKKVPVKQIVIGTSGRILSEG